MRHGETEFNRQERILGLGLEPLNARGQAQAVAVASVISSDSPSILYSSPVVRAIQTAEVIAARSSIRVKLLPAVAELDSGQVEGLTIVQLQQQFPDVLQAWRENPAVAVMPDGESLADVQKRAWISVKDITKRHSDDNVVIVAHNFSIQTILCKCLDIPLKNFRQLRIDLGSITRIRVIDSVFTLLTLNDTSHL